MARIPYGSSHGIFNQQEAASGVPHGLCFCMLLHALLRYNQEVADEADALIANTLGRDPNCESLTLSAELFAATPTIF